MAEFTRWEIYILLNQAKQPLWLAGIDLSGAYLRGADLSKAYLYKANLAEANLEQAKLAGANLEYANLMGASLNYANLKGANLRYAILTKARLEHADLTEAWLVDAHLSEADLDGANLTGAYVRDADLRGAYLSTANLTGCNLEKADLRGANLGGTNLENARLYGALYDGNTEWPWDFDPKAAGAILQENVAATEQDDKEKDRSPERKAVKALGGVLEFLEHPLMGVCFLLMLAGILSTLYFALLIIVGVGAEALHWLGWTHRTFADVHAAFRQFQDQFQWLFDINLFRRVESIDSAFANLVISGFITGIVASIYRILAQELEKKAGA